MVTQTENTTPPTEPFTPTAEQADTLAALIDWQGKLEKNDGIFCRDHLSYSATVWYRIKSGDYWNMVANRDPIFATLDKDLRRLEREQSIAARHAGAEWFPFADFKAVQSAVDEARAKPISDPDRLIVFLADTGGGKTRLCGRLAQDGGAVIIEAREAWKTSYFNCLKDFATALGVDTRNNPTKGEMEEAILRELNKKRAILAVDEGEFFAAQSLNLIKLVLNKTPTVIVICAMPEAYARWNRANWHEARQIRRRTHALVVQEVIHPDEAARFLRKGPASAVAAAAGPHLAAAANQFGRFDLCKRVATSLRAGHPTADLEDVKKAITREQTLLGFTPTRR